MMSILLKVTNSINNLRKRKKNSQSPVVYGNQFTEICRLNFNKDSYFEF